MRSQVQNMNPNPMMNPRALVTNRLNGAQKMELYKSCTEGRLSDFIQLIERKGYPILEEISAKNFNWSSLSYSLHYGKLEIVDYIMTYLQREGKLEAVMKLKTSDGRSPLLCLLRSSNINSEVKKKMFVTLCNKFRLEIDPEVKNELKGRKIDDVLAQLTYLPH